MIDCLRSSNPLPQEQLPSIPFMESEIVSMLLRSCSIKRAHMPLYGFLSRPVLQFTVHLFIHSRCADYFHHFHLSTLSNNQLFIPCTDNLRNSKSPICSSPSPPFSLASSLSPLPLLPMSRACATPLEASLRTARQPTGLAVSPTNL